MPQHTFSLIPNLATSVHRYHADAQAGRWVEAGTFPLLTYPVFELAGQTLGVICSGVARIAEGFRMRVLANHISDSGYQHTQLYAQLRESDIVTAHTPLTEATADLIGTAGIDSMMRMAFLINTARGSIVNDQGPADALYPGRRGL